MFTPTDKFQDALTELRSKEFLYTMNLASGTQMMKRIVRGSIPYRLLRECLADDVDGYTDAISLELHRLTKLRFDRAFANPYDEQMTVLTLVLLDVGYEWEDFSDFLKSADLCFWLRHI